MPASSLYPLHSFIHSFIQAIARLSRPQHLPPSYHVHPHINMQALGLLPLHEDLLWGYTRGLDTTTAQCACGDQHRCPPHLHRGNYDNRGLVRQRRPSQRHADHVFLEEEDWHVLDHTSSIFRHEFCCAWDEFCHTNHVMVCSSVFSTEQPTQRKKKIKYLIILTNMCSIRCDTDSKQDGIFSGKCTASSILNNGPLAV